MIFQIIQFPQFGIVNNLRNLESNYKICVLVLVVLCILNMRYVLLTLNLKYKFSYLRAVSLFIALFTCAILTHDALVVDIINDIFDKSNNK